VGLRIGNNKDGDRFLIRDETGMCRQIWTKQELEDVVLSASEIQTDYALIEETFPLQSVEGYEPLQRLYLQKDTGQVWARSSRM
jgi:hypothetical protein